MADPTFLPLLTDQPERRDAARNREALLEAAARLVERCGAATVTTEAVAAEAGVGKGTVFRRYGSRAGLMAAVLDHSETEWQRAVLAGPPPLGPGAPPLTRLLAFGRSRIELNVLHADLIAAAGRAGTRSSAAYAFSLMHVRYLLRELGVTGDLGFLAGALLAPMEPVVLGPTEEFPIERVQHGWVDLVQRVAAR